MQKTSKRLIVLAFFMSLVSVSMGQLRVKATCPEMYVDVLTGTVNELKPSNTPDEIKAKFPCFTSTPDDSSKCGAGIFFKDKDIYFYTKRKYIEIGPKFTGKLSIPLLGAKRGSLFKSLGNPKLKDDHWDAFETQYGTLVLHYDAVNKVKLIQFSTLTTETLNLCE